MRRKYAVYHHVGVAANGGGEVRIVFKAKRKMPDIFVTIHRFCHGTQCRSLHHLLFRVSFYGAHEFCDVFALYLARACFKVVVPNCAQEYF